MSRILSYTEAIREATEIAMKNDPTVIIMGLGVTYKNGADGTMGNLKEEYPDRVFDTPVSEACVTGAGVGAAITGLKPIIHHGRIEFGLFAIDQIITQAAKWNYMFGGNNNVPIVFRLAIGRQWGNGPQHTQALYSLFGNVPGLKVVIPSTPSMAKGLMLSAIKDKNPVIFLEPRWLYGVKEIVSEEYYETPLDKGRIVSEGSDITIVSYGDGIVDTIRANEILKQYKISAEIIDLVSINPIDYDIVIKSVKKTKSLLCVDTTNNAFSVGSEIIAKVCEKAFDFLYQKPVNLTAPNTPCPTSTVLSELYYPTRVDIVNKVLKMFYKLPYNEVLTFDELHLSPKITI
jgi:pyruvate/2-oxoglutarate/acetoin dehydrogenase E1 component